MQNYTKIEASDLSGKIEQLFFLYEKGQSLVIGTSSLEGVNAFFIVEKVDSKLRLVSLENRFESFEVEFDRFRELIWKFVNFFKLSDFEAAIYLGYRGLAQFLTTQDCNSYFLKEILKTINSEDALETMIACASKLGLSIQFNGACLSGEMSKKEHSNKIFIGNESIYTSDFNSILKKLDSTDFQCSLLKK